MSLGLPETGSRKIFSTFPGGGKDAVLSSNPVLTGFCPVLRTGFEKNPVLEDRTEWPEDRGQNSEDRISRGQNGLRPGQNVLRTGQDRIGFPGQNAILSQDRIFLS